MRVARTLAALALLLASAAHAQDLQYKTVTTMVMPSAPIALPTPSTTTYIHGTRMRSDTDLESPMGAIHMSMIMNSQAGSVIMLRHDDKTYTERPLEMPAEIKEMTGNLTKDSIKLIKMTDTLTLAGFRAHRVIYAMPFGGKMLSMFPVKAGMRMILVSDTWFSDDPRLSDAAKQFGKTMQDASTGLSSLGIDDPDVGGFPLRMMTYMVQVPANEPFDAAAIAKAGEQAPNLVMKSEMNVKDIQFGPVNPAMFEIPKGYTKTTRSF